jgi:hypothetical protein
MATAKKCRERWDSSFEVAKFVIDSMGSDFSALEEAMMNASRGQSNIICHEL